MKKQAGAGPTPRRAGLGRGARLLAFGVLGANALFSRVAVEGDSMRPTLEPGDRLLVLRLWRARGLREDDLVTIRDQDQRINALYGTVQIPETYIIDKQGVLRRKFIGAQDWTSPNLMAYLAKM